MSEYTLQRKHVDGQRFYEVTETSNIVGLFPSITTVLSGTSDKSSLVAWRERIGEVEADRISKLSMNRGTVMHRLIELYKLIPGTPNQKLDRLKEIAAEDAEVNEFASDELGELFLEEGWQMFMKFWHNQPQFFSRINKVIESETFLWSIKGGGFAGTVDNVSEMIDGKVIIIDYKNSRKPKREDWIDDYKIQASAYWVAYWERSGVKPDGAEIWIASESASTPQIFKIDNTEIRYYFKEFQDRLKTFKEKFNI